MSQDALAAITGIPQPNLSKIERGRVAVLDEVVHGDRGGWGAPHKVAGGVNGSIGLRGLCS